MSQAYVLVEEDGKAAYEKLTSEGAVNLIGSDKDCTGTNDTSLSEQYYARGKGVPKPSSTSVSVMTAKSVTKTSATASPPTAAAPPKGVKKSSAVHQVSLGSAFLVAMVLAPLFGPLL